METKTTYGEITYHQISDLINKSCTFNELDEINELINDFSYKCDDQNLINNLRDKHEKAILELCGNG